MYTVLHLNCTEDVSTFLKRTIHGLGPHVQILSCHSASIGYGLIQKHTVQCVIADLHQNPEESIQFLQKWQKDSDCCQNVLILIVDKHEDILSAISRLHFCEVIINPVTAEKKQIIRTFLHRHYTLHLRLKSTLELGELNNSLCLKTEQGFEKCHINDVLYIEAAKHKCLLHTRESTFIVSQPLCKLRECAIFDGFLQSHRSFLINPTHIKQVDTTTNTWTISFVGSDKQAFVSRSHKKTFEKNLFTYS